MSDGRNSMSSPSPERAEPPPGWYDSPQGTGLRWWNGQEWTEHHKGPAATQQAPEPGKKPAWDSYNYLPGESPQAAPDPNAFSKVGIACGVLAFLFFPVVLGPIGIILGAIGIVRKERLAPVALAVAGAGFIAGMVIGLAVAGF